MATTKWDIVDRVQDIVTTTTGSAVIGTMVEDAKILAENVTGQSIDMTDVGSKWHGLLTSLGGAYLSAHDEGAGGAVIGYRLGEFQVTKQGTSESTGQMSFLVARANDHLNWIGRRMSYGKTEPTV